MTDAAGTENATGFRERIKAAESIEEARTLMADVHRLCPARYVKRCQRVFDQLPFVKESA